MSPGVQRALVFSGEAQLATALRAGLIPKEVAAREVRYHRQPDGALELLLDPPWPNGQEEELRRAGVGWSERRRPWRTAKAWAELLSPSPVEESELELGVVLFELSAATSLLELGGELIRLGTEQLAWRWVQDEDGARLLLRAERPPYYTVLRALDQGRGMRAYLPAPGSSRERVWVELGFRHPAERSIEPAAEQVLLVRGDGSWSVVQEGPWAELLEEVQLVLPAQALPLQPQRERPRLSVALRLVQTSKDEPATLWVLEQQAVAVLDRLVQALPEAVLGSLSFAVGTRAEGGPPVALLRARGDRRADDLEVPGRPFAAHPGVPNLFVPRGSFLEPPLSRDRLRAVLAPVPEDIVWLAPAGESGAFRVERIADDAFTALGDWVDYLAHAHAPALERWVRSTVFDFSPFLELGGEQVAASQVAETRPVPSRVAPAGVEPRGLPEEQPKVEQPPPPREALDPALFRGISLADHGAEEQALLELERRFLEEVADGPEREQRAAWLELARHNARLGRRAEAGGCFVRALWEASAEESWAIARAWVSSELGMAEPERLQQALEPVAQPTVDQVRATAALIIAGRRGDAALEPLVRARRELLLPWLEDQDGVLDVRCAWLAREALASIGDGDRLALARARDTVLERMRGGLSLGRDVPAFLRYLGGGRPTGSGDAAHLGEALEQLQLRFERTRRQRSAVEAPAELTQAYVHLVFAHGFARLGNTGRSRALVARAQGALPAADPVHAFLLRAYQARIEQALEGLPRETPLPPEVAVALDGLEKFARYKVDRLRQMSSILEPQERLDPIKSYILGERDVRGKELAPLRGLSDRKLLGEALDGLLARAKESSPEDRARLYDGIMDFVPLVPTRAAHILQQIAEHLGDVPPERRTLLLAEALSLAAHFGYGDRTRRLAAQLLEEIEGLSGAGVMQAARDVGHALRGLLRSGFKAEALHLLEALDQALLDDGLSARLGRLQIAAGAAYLGEVQRALPALEAGHAMLKSPELKVPERLKLIRALAETWSRAPLALALGGLGRLAEQLPLISDSYNTNSHFCLSVVELMEALVSGYASDDLALGERGRRFLDQDEQRVRREIYRLSQDLG